MTVPATQNRNDYDGNGTTASYAYTFRIFNKTQMRVIIADTVALTADVILTLDVDYTVSGAGTAGGTVTIINPTYLSGGFLPTGKHLTLVRHLTMTQNLDIRNQGDYFPESIEDEFDYVTMLEQQQQENLDRMLAFPQSEDHTSNPLVLPGLVARKNSYLVFDNNGDPQAAKATIPSTAVSSFWAGMLVLANASLSRIGLGFAGPGGTVETANISPAGLASAAYAALSVVTAAIGNAAVTTAKIANLAITTALIADGNVTAAKLDPGVFTTVFPTGGLLPFGGTAAPTGFLMCDGSPVSRTTYASLFAVIGTAYGNGDGATTFHLPLTKGRFLRGIADYAVANGSGNAAANNATFTAHPYKQTGVKVRMTAGALAGLASATDYWVIYIDPNTLAFATSLFNARNGIKIALAGANTAAISQFEDPDASTRVASTGGANSGATVGSFEDQDYLAHTHTGAQTANAFNSNVAGGGHTVQENPTNVATGASGGLETRPVNVAVHYIIKT